MQDLYTTVVARPRQGTGQPRLERGGASVGPCSHRRVKRVAAARSRHAESSSGGAGRREPAQALRDLCAIARPARPFYHPAAPNIPCGGADSASPYGYPREGRPIGAIPRAAGRSRSGYFMIIGISSPASHKCHEGYLRWLECTGRDLRPARTGAADAGGASDARSRDALKRRCRHRPRLHYRLLPIHSRETAGSCGRTTWEAGATRRRLSRRVASSSAASTETSAPSAPRAGTSSGAPISTARSSDLQL